MIDTIEAYGLKFLVPARDTHVGKSLRDHGEFALPELHFLLEHTAGEPGTILDVGANIGAFSIPLAARRPRWRVIAYEASPVIAQLLSDCARANELTNLEVVAAAAGAAAGSTSFHAVRLNQVGNFGSLSAFPPPEAETVEVPVVTLDDTAPLDVRLVKVDVQGFEAEVLKGATRLLHETKPIWLVEADTTDWVENYHAVHAMLSAAGYRLHWFYSPFATLLARGKVEEPGRGDASVVALPPGSPNRWSLPEVAGPTDRRPGLATDYPYLPRYGY